MPADVRRYALAYTRAADRGDMLRALELRASWPAGLLECSCERGATRDGEDDARGGVRAIAQEALDALADGLAGRRAEAVQGLADAAVGLVAHGFALLLALWTFTLAARSAAVRSPISMSRSSTLSARRTRSGARSPTSEAAAS